MAVFEMIQTTTALAGLTVLMFLCHRLKRALKGYHRNGAFLL